VQQSLGLTLGELVDRDARPGGHHRGDVLVGDLVVDHPLVGALGRLGLVNRRFDPRDDLVVELRGFLVIALAHRAVELDARFAQSGFQLAHILQRGFFLRPALLQGIEFVFFDRHVVAQFREALFGRLVFFFLECELFDFHPVDHTAQFVDFDR